MRRLIGDSERDIGKRGIDVCDINQVIVGCRRCNDHFALVGHQVQETAVRIHVHATQVHASWRAKNAYRDFTKALRELLEHRVKQTHTFSKNRGIRTVHAVERPACRQIVQVKAAQPFVCSPLVFPSIRHNWS